jgi:hypothetical protein
MRIRRQGRSVKKKRIQVPLVWLLLVRSCFVFAFINQSSGWTSQETDSYGCNYLTIVIKDSMGVVVPNASITLEDSVMEYRTDFNGKAEVPCRQTGRMPQTYKVSAAGYREIAITPPRDGYGNVEILLDRAKSAKPMGANFVSVKELFSKSEKRLNSLLKKANRALKLRKYQDAESLLREGFRINPSSAFHENGLGIIALLQGRYSESESWFQTAAQSASCSPDILGDLGFVRWARNQRNESYDIIRRAVSLGYESELGRYILGTMSMEKGLAAEAVQSLKKVSADLFPYRDLYLSIAFRNLGKTKSAEASYRRF